MDVRPLSNPDGTVTSDQFRIESASSPRGTTAVSNDHPPAKAKLNAFTPLAMDVRPDSKSSGTLTSFHFLMESAN